MISKRVRATRNERLLAIFPREWQSLQATEMEPLFFDRVSEYFRRESISSRPFCGSVAPCSHISAFLPFF